MFSRAVSSMSKPAPSSIKGAMLPLMVQVPSVGSSTPAMILSMVDFPEPFVPRMPNTSPLRTVNDTPSSARNSLNISSRFARAMAYSFKLLSCWDAMLKTMDTRSTSTMTGRSSTVAASSRSMSPSGVVLMFSGIDSA